MRTLTSILGFLVLGLGLTRAAGAATTCAIPQARVSVLRYFGPADRSLSRPDALCTYAGDLVGCSQQGWLYKPAGAGPFPAVVLVHSQEAGGEVSEYCAITEHLIEQGHVVFVPLRRGYHPVDGSFTNTGELPATTLDRLELGGIGAPAPASPLAGSLRRACEADGLPGLTGAERDCASTLLQQDQVREMAQAVAVLKRQFTGSGLLVKADHVAILGHAVGANIATFAAADASVGIRAAVLVSPAERSWDNTSLRAALKQAADAHVVPISVLQPRDGESVDPTRRLAEHAAEHGSTEVMSALFPSVGGSAAEVQRRFATAPAEVDRWVRMARWFMELSEEPKEGREACQLRADVTRTQVNYHAIPSQEGDPLCDTNEDGTQECHLAGVVYAPDVPGPRPAVIVNHGAGKSRQEDEYCDIASYFTARGYVVLAPWRRGIRSETRRDDPPNTGRYYGDVMEQYKASGLIPLEALPFSIDCEHDYPDDFRDCLTLGLLRDERRELLAAASYLVQMPESQGLVDPARISWIGHSNGAILTLLAATDVAEDDRPLAVIALDPNENSYHAGSPKSEALLEAAANLQVPFAVMQPANADNIHSTIELAKVAAADANRKRFLAQVFPPVDQAACQLDTGDPEMSVHQCFPRHGDQVRRWGPMARFFMETYGMR